MIDLHPNCCSKLIQSFFSVTTVSWTLTSLPVGFTEDEIVKTIQHSMNKWTAELPLQFIYKGRYKNANVTIGFFAAIYHTIWHQGTLKNCTFPFKSDTLAHAHGLDHTPNVRGHIHFNGLYRWSL
jgi:hypothetical protein